MTEFIGWEAAAVTLAVVYLWLAIRQNIWCWAAAAVSTTIYLFLMYRAGLYMESALQLFYLAMAAYGWWSWRGGRTGDELPVTRWTLRRHAVALAVVALLVLLSGTMLARYTQAALPFWDSLTTWGAVVATYMVARKILENWMYWFVIDAISVGLYTARELYLTAILFLGYLVMIVIGYRRWRASIETSA